MPGTTTNGLPYPTSGDQIKDTPAKVQELAQAVDDKTLAAMTAYTPAWTAVTTNPNKGTTGTITGFYRERGKTIEGYIKINLAGTGVNAGSGQYSWSLPVQPKSDHTDVAVGVFAIVDGGVFQARVLTVASTAGTGTVRAIDAGAGGAVASGTFTPAAGDTLTLSFRYERT